MKYEACKYLVLLLLLFKNISVVTAQENAAVIKAVLSIPYSELVKEDMHACCKGFCAKNNTASSTLKNKTGVNYGIKNIEDDNKNTAWVEGKEGDGVGEYLEFDYAYDIKFIEAADGACQYKDEFYILNGYQKNETIWAENNRVKKIKMYVNGKLFCYVLLLDKMGAQSMRLNFIKLLGRKKNAITIRFEIAEVYKGSKYSDTAISEIYW